MQQMKLILIACALLFPFSSFAYSSENPADEIDHQMMYVDKIMNNIERQRSEQIAEQKLEIDRYFARQKKNVEAQLSIQLAGLSGTLSGLPEMPQFNGKFSEVTAEHPRL